MNKLNSSIGGLTNLLEIRQKELKKHHMVRDYDKIEKINADFMEEVIFTFNNIERLIKETTK